MLRPDRLKLAADGDLVKLGQPLLGRAGGEAPAGPGERESITGGADHEHRHPDRRRIRAGEHDAEHDRDDRHRRADEAAEGAPSLSPVNPSAGLGTGLPARFSIG